MMVKTALLHNPQLVPVVVLHDSAHAIPLVDAITAAGGMFIEITLRTSAALDAIKQIKALRPDCIVGAGTVLTVDDAKQAIAAGSDFLVSPGYPHAVVDYALENNILIIPGCITPTEVQYAMRKGLDLLKFFPAEQAGGTAMLKAFASVYPAVTFMPTGGVNASNLGEYIALPNTKAIGGTWVCSDALIRAGKFAEITNLLKAANAQFS